MNCNCQDWKENIGKINAPIMLQAARSGFSPSAMYNGVRFRYCPWCALPLHDAGEVTAAVGQSAPVATSQTIVEPSDRNALNKSGMFKTPPSEQWMEAALASNEEPEVIGPASNALNLQRKACELIATLESFGWVTIEDNKFATQRKMLQKIVEARFKEVLSSHAPRPSSGSVSSLGNLSLQSDHPMFSSPSSHAPESSSGSNSSKFRDALQELLDNALIQRGIDDDALICYDRQSFIEKLRKILSPSPSSPLLETEQ